MTKFFGQYLIEKELIREEQLLDALMFQLKSTSSTAEVIYAGKLLSVPDQLKILSHQQMTGSDYRSSAVALNLWPESLRESVGREIQLGRKPLGECLISLGYVKPESLNALFDGYIESLSQERAKPKQIRPGDGPESEIAIDKELDPVLCKEFATLVHEKSVPSMKRYSVTLLATPTVATSHDETLQSCARDLNAVRAAATFLGADLSKSLATELGSAINAVIGNQQGDRLASLSQLLKYGAAVFDGLAHLIHGANSEGPANADLNLKDLVIRVRELCAQFSK
jgi:hypothetical protein